MKLRVIITILMAVTSAIMIIKANAAAKPTVDDCETDIACIEGVNWGVETTGSVANASLALYKAKCVQMGKKDEAISSPCMVEGGVIPDYVARKNIGVGLQVNDASVAEQHRTFNGIRPFGANAPWNIPVNNLPRHPQSAEYAGYLWNDNATERSQRNFNLNFNEYTYPVYNAELATAEYRVSSTSGFGNLNDKKIPFNPQWSQNEGTDGQIIILDPRTGREWDLWQVAVNPLREGITISNGNLCPGDYFTNDYRSESLQCRGSRGAGINYLAMLVRPWEIEKGRIEHALSMPIPGTSGSFFVPPATKLEFPGKAGNIPEGMRFALDVSYGQIDDHIASIKGLSPAKQRFARIILTALKEYGWFITDTSGGTHLQFEAPESARSEWEELGVLPQQTIGGKTYPRDVLDGFITKERIITIVPSDQY